MERKHLIILALLAACSFTVGRITAGRDDDPSAHASARPFPAPTPTSASAQTAPSSKLTATEPGEHRYKPSAIRKRANRGLTLDDLGVDDRKALFARAESACLTNLNLLSDFERASSQIVSQSEDGQQSVTHVPKPPPGHALAILHKGLEVFEDYGEFSLPAQRQILGSLQKKIHLNEQDLYLLTDSSPSGSNRFSVSGLYADGEIKFTFSTNSDGTRKTKRSGAYPRSQFSLTSNQNLFQKRFGHLFESEPGSASSEE